MKVFVIYINGKYAGITCQRSMHPSSQNTCSQLVCLFVYDFCFSDITFNIIVIMHHLSRNKIFCLLLSDQKRRMIYFKTLLIRFSE